MYVDIANTVNSDFNGFAGMNILVYCLIAGMTSFVLNPVIAYVLSRFTRRGNYIFTFTLPAIVILPIVIMNITAIIKVTCLNVLTVVWIGWLPCFFCGCTISMLKFFFDSLPEELYETAVIYCSSEFNIFLQILLSLIRPVLVLSALNSLMLGLHYLLFALPMKFCNANQESLTVNRLQEIGNSETSSASAALLAVSLVLFFFTFQAVVMRSMEDNIS